jgi:uncharacterized membrane protein YcaP (DUF421 family)
MHDLVMHMFTLAPPALETVLEKVARPVVVYLFLVIALRLGGKRELAQLNPLDLVVLLTLSNTVQNAIIGEDNTVIGGLIGATTLLALNHLVVRYAFRHPRVEGFIDGKPSVLIDKGVMKRATLGRELLSTGELLSAAHRQGFTSLSEVERAVLEPGGSLTFTGKEPTLDARRHAELLARLDVLLDRLGR